MAGSEVRAKKDDRTGPCSLAFSKGPQTQCAYLGGIEAVMVRTFIVLRYVEL